MCAPTAKNLARGCVRRKIVTARAESVDLGNAEWLIPHARSSRGGEGASGLDDTRSSTVALGRLRSNHCSVDGDAKT